MAYTIYSPAGAQPIANTFVGVADPDTAVVGYKHTLGQRALGTDPTFGEGEFVYLIGVASTEVGSIVNWNSTTWQTVLLTATGQKNKGTPVAIAMSANIAASGGWYQIRGNAVLKKTTVSVGPGVAIYSSATAGRVKVLASAGQQIVGATTANLTTVVTTTSTVVVTINAPHTQSQIT